MSNMHQHYHEMKRSKKLAEDLVRESLKAKKRLERRVPILLLMAIGQVMLYKAGVAITPIAAMFVLVMVGCAIHSAYLIRRYEENMEKCQEVLDSIKKETEQEPEKCCE